MFKAVVLFLLFNVTFQQMGRHVIMYIPNGTLFPSYSALLLTTVPWTHSALYRGEGEKKKSVTWDVHIVCLHFKSVLQKNTLMERETALRHIISLDAIHYIFRAVSQSYCRLRLVLD